MQNIQKRSFFNYIIAIIVFLFFMLISILLFFYAVRKSTDSSTKNTISQNVRQQKDHFAIILNEQYENLEGLSRYMGHSKDLFSEKNKNLILHLSETTSFHRISIFKKDGTCYTSDGITTNASSRNYFQRSLKGKRALSDPLESIIDNKNLVALSVPIFDDNNQVKGVLGGTYNVEKLRQMLFRDLYNGNGYSFIVTSTGTLVSIDEEKLKVSGNQNFFKYYEKAFCKDGVSLKTIKKDFKNQEKNCRTICKNDDSRYIAYQPLGFKDWMICYVIPVDAAQDSFAFIKFYELILSGVLAAAVTLLLAAIWEINKRSQHSLMKKAQTDSLTGVLNKESTEVQISKWLDSRECEGIQALLMIDLDKFKQINDTYGHAIGDNVLKHTADLLKGIFRESDIIGRIGGDEFVILMKNVRQEIVVLQHMEEVCKKLNLLEIETLHRGKINCSIGAAYAPKHGQTFMELYTCADKALYQVKKNGRGGYIIYEEDHDNIH